MVEKADQLTEHLKTLVDMAAAAKRAAPDGARYVVTGRPAECTGQHHQFWHARARVASFSFPWPHGQRPWVEWLLSIRAAGAKIDETRRRNCLKTQVTEASPACSSNQNNTCDITHILVTNAGLESVTAMEVLDVTRAALVVTRPFGVAGYVGVFAFLTPHCGGACLQAPSVLSYMRTHAQTPIRTHYVHRTPFKYTKQRQTQR